LEKKILIFNLIICVNIGFSQSKICDCIVKIEPAKLYISLHELGLLWNDEIPKEYQPLLPLKTGTTAYHKIIKDSAAFWFIQPHPREPKSKYSTVQSKKLPTTFLVRIQFNGKDSIPVYTEANEKSKIMRYIKRGKENTEDNDYWFVGCKPGFVKLKFIEQTMPSGWISKENYLHK